MIFPVESNGLANKTLPGDSVLGKKWTNKSNRFIIVRIIKINYYFFKYN